MSDETKDLNELNEIDDDGSIIRKGQVRAKKGFRPGEAPPPHAEPRVLGFLHAQDLEKKGDVTPAEVLQFHKDAKEIIERIFEDEIPDLLLQPAQSESYEVHEGDKHTFDGRITWREQLDSQHPTQYREIEIQRIEPNKAGDGPLYSFVVRYMKDDSSDDRATKQGKEFILTMGQKSDLSNPNSNVSDIVGASIWQYKQTDGDSDHSYVDANIHFDKDGKPIKTSGKEPVYSKDIHLIDTFKHWVSKMPGMKVK